MATSTKQDEDFLNTVVGTGILETAIEWITTNMSPEEVFSERDLISWAEDQRVDDIFSKAQMEEWTMNNGYYQK